MTTKPIQLTDDAFLMLRKAIGHLNAETGLRVGAGDIVPAAELIEAGYGAIRDTNDGPELRATPAGIEYMKMIDALLEAAGADSTVNSEIPEQYRWDSSEENVSDERRGVGP
jgi:hypothetical protein